MHLRRPTACLLLAFSLAGCAHGAASPSAPAAPEVAPDVAASEAPAEEPAPPPTDSPRATQTISFADDIEAGPTTEVRSAPQRPPIPSFQLFGTRAGDGP